ncbi:MAG: CO dehydrogenase accessory protein CooC (nickel insertion), partial [uncultured Thermomicrobiales bacterium]
EGRGRRQGRFRQDDDRGHPGPHPGPGGAAGPGDRRGPQSEPGGQSRDRSRDGGPRRIGAALVRPPRQRRRRALLGGDGHLARGDRAPLRHARAGRRDVAAGRSGRGPPGGRGL